MVIKKSWVLGDTAALQSFQIRRCPYLHTYEGNILLEEEKKVSAIPFMNLLSNPPFYYPTHVTNVMVLWMRRQQYMFTFLLKITHTQESVPDVATSSSFFFRIHPWKIWLDVGRILIFFSSTKQTMMLRLKTVSPVFFFFLTNSEWRERKRKISCCLLTNCWLFRKKSNFQKRLTFIHTFLTWSSVAAAAEHFSLFSKFWNSKRQNSCNDRHSCSLVTPKKTLWNPKPLHLIKGEKCKVPPTTK